GNRGSECIIDRAVRKYGRDNFEVCTLAEAHTLEELNLLEEFHIKAQNTLSPHGYNLLPGGNNRTVHPDTKRRISQSMIGREFSSEHRKNLSVASTGRVLSEATIAKR